MPKVIFKKLYRYFPSEKGVVVVYQPKDEPQAVNQECAERAVAAGVAKMVQERKVKTASETESAGEEE